MPDRRPVTVSILNDYEVVVAGVARMLEPYADRVVVVEIAANQPAQKSVDVALYDTFAQPDAADLDRRALLNAASAQRLVVFCWELTPTLMDTLAGTRVDGFVSKRVGAAELVEALERVHAGEQVRPPESRTDESQVFTGLTEDDDGDDAMGWPGREQGLTARESEILALIVLGLSNVEVGARAYLSVNTIKSYIRSAYRKMGVQSRSQAVLWGIDHGFRPDVMRRQISEV